MSISAVLKKYKNTFLPVETNELCYFLPLFFMKFLASFTYTILNATKDTVIVTSKGSGAEVIPILKGGVVLVIAFLFMLIYSKLSNKLTRENLFYTVLSPFIVFFLIYGLYLYPNKDIIGFHNTSDFLLSIIGENHQHWIAVYRYWMHSLFFVFAEMWGGIMIGLLFWGFANQITSVEKAAKFYALYTVGGHIGTIFAGRITLHFAKFVSGDFTLTVKIMMLIAVVATLLIIGLYWYTNKFAITNNSLSPCIKLSKSKKNKLSLGESLKFIMRSPYLGLIAMLVIGYGISMNMVEVSWKALLKMQYPNSSDYQAFMGTLQTGIGTASLLVALFISGSLIRKYGWARAAIVPPVVLGIMSILFFALFFLYKNDLISSVNFFGFSPLFLVVVVGAIHNVSCKAMKYCIFDPTKEMAYITLDEESKTKGKAAVDVVGGRFGKSSSSWIQLALIDLIGSGSVLGVVHILVPIVILVVFGWLFAVKRLNNSFSELNLETNRSDITIQQSISPAS